MVSEKLIKRVTKRVAEKRIAIRRVRKRQRLLNGNHLETKQIPMLVGTNVKPWLTAMKEYWKQLCRGLK